MKSTREAGPTALPTSSPASAARCSYSLRAAWLGSSTRSTYANLPRSACVTIYCRIAPMRVLIAWAIGTEILAPIRFMTNHVVKRPAAVAAGAGRVSRRSASLEAGPCVPPPVLLPGGTATGSALDVARTGRSVGRLARSDRYRRPRARLPSRTSLPPSRLAGPRRFAPPLVAAILHCM